MIAQGEQKDARHVVPQPLRLPLVIVVVNHTGHNQIYKEQGQWIEQQRFAQPSSCYVATNGQTFAYSSADNHRNGIKKTRRPRKMSMAGMNCRFVRNQAFAKRGMSKLTAEEKAEQIAAQKEDREGIQAQKKVDEKRKAERQG
eukprot:Skav207651  [mRNA]  locus=scaffold2758:85845:93499:+ [translate_table: standard]